MKLKNKFLLPLLIISILLGINHVRAFTTTVYTDNLMNAIFNSVQTYSDGTFLITLTYDNTSEIGIGFPAIRLIHPNGSVTAFDVPFRCNEPGKCPTASYPLGSDYIFVVHKATYDANETTYGLVVDWNGKILSRYYDRFKC